MNEIIPTGDQRHSLFDAILRRHRRSRFHHTYQSVANLREIAEQVDLTDPYMSMLFADALEELQISARFSEADMQADLERIFGFQPEPENPDVIKGEIIQIEDSNDHQNNEEQ